MLQEDGDENMEMKIKVKIMENIGWRYRRQNKEKHRGKYLYRENKKDKEGKVGGG